MRATTAAVFAAATVAKALEPLSVGHSAPYPYSFGWAIGMVEITKLLVCAFLLALQLRNTTTVERAALVQVRRAGCCDLRYENVNVVCM